MQFRREIGLAAADLSGYHPASFHQIPLANTDQTEPTALGGRDRLLLAAAGIGLMGLLLLAALLRPDPSGYGTHRQLGFPPCTFLALFGRPCPTCGMTTAWADLVRGECASAFRANVGGTLLGMLAVVAAPWLLGSAIRGRWLGISPNGTAAAWISTTVLVVTLIHWVYRLLAG